MRLKFRDAAREVIPTNVSAARTREDGQRRALSISNEASPVPPRPAGSAEGDEQGRNGTLVGRWHSSMFEARQAGDNVEVWRKPDMISGGDVRDAARRNDIAGIKALNELNRQRYGAK